MIQTSAKAIYQAHLDVVTQALWDLDMPTLLRLLPRPATIGTKEGQVRLTTETQKRDMIFSTRKSLDALGAAAYLRLAEQAEFTTPARTEINGRHISYALSGGSFVIAPFSSRQTIVLQNGEWCSIGIDSDLEQNRMQLLSPGIDLRRSQKSDAGTRGTPSPVTD